jgi:hypothetical protein
MQYRRSGKLLSAQWFFSKGKFQPLIAVERCAVITAGPAIALVYRKAKRRYKESRE